MNSQSSLDLLKGKIKKTNIKLEKLNVSESAEYKKLNSQRELALTSLTLKNNLNDRQKDIGNKINQLKEKNKHMREELFLVEKSSDLANSLYSKMLDEFNENEQYKKTEKYKNIEKLMVFYDATGRGMFRVRNEDRINNEIPKYAKYHPRNKIKPRNINFILEKSKDHKDYSNLFINFTLTNHTEFPIQTRYSSTSVLIMKKLKRATASGLGGSGYSFECPKEELIAVKETVNVSCKYNGYIRKAEEYGFEKEKEVTFLLKLSLTDTDFKLFKDKFKIIIEKYKYPKNKKIEERTRLVSYIKKYYRKLNSVSEYELTELLIIKNSEAKKLIVEREAHESEVITNGLQMKSMTKKLVNIKHKLIGINKKIKELNFDKVVKNLKSLEESKQVEVTELSNIISSESRKYDLALSKHKSLTNIILGM